MVQKCDRYERRKSGVRLTSAAKHSELTEGAQYAVRKKGVKKDKKELTFNL